MNHQRSGNMYNPNKVAIFLIVSAVIGDGRIDLAVAAPNVVVATHEEVAGLYQHEYANMWWQWAVSMNSAESPVIDKTGEKCGVNQAGPVWFLAGGYGTSKIRRECSIPSDKYIFFPVINTIFYPSDPEANLSCESVKKEAAVNNQHLRSFKVAVDDQVLVNPVFHRVSSNKCFDLVARKENNPKQLEAYPSATDGYWIMLKPLSVGTHRISFHAEYHQPGRIYGKMTQDIEYIIEIHEP